MKVFISWSGQYSKECAEILRDWIKCTLQASEPWISSRDIDKGSLWFNEISNQLKDTKVGIVCLTQNNKEKPWILFEAGALAKGISANRVCTFLMNLKPSDLDAPLSQFNHTMPEKEEMKNLLSSINNELGENALEEKILNQVFETYWPSFEDKFKNLKNSEEAPKKVKPSRSNEDILEEILYTTRTMDKRIRSLEMEKQKPSFPPREKILREIERMIENGLNPDEVLDNMRGLAPSHFIRRTAIELWESKHASEAGKNDDDEIPF